MTAPVWTLSGFGDEIDPDPDVQLAVLQALGARAIEVRSIHNINIVDLEPEQLTVLAELVRRRGHQVSAIASPVGKVSIDQPIEAELARLDRAIAAAHALDTHYIRIFSFYPEAGRRQPEMRDQVLAKLQALTAAAAAADVILLHENEKEIYGDVPARVLDVVESVGSDHLRLAWDAANFVQVGVRPHTDGWAALAPYVDYIQIKDALTDTKENVPAGQGDGEILATLTALRETGYSGYLSLEPHLATAGRAGGFSGPARFGEAARALTTLVHQIGVSFA